MKKMKFAKSIIIILLIAVFIVSAILLWQKTDHNLFVLLYCTALLFSSLLTLFLFNHINNRRDETLIKALSDLISSISDEQMNMIFPEFDDSLLSKLQNQLLRLHEMLNSRNTLVEEEKNNIKSLISDISHQLKTPLATVKMYSEFLTDENLTADERTSYDAALSSAVDRLLFLSESLIKMTRLESGVISLKKEAANLSETIIEAIQQSYRKAEKKHMSIIFDTDNPATILSHDRHWTAEALFNIIDNAIKYGEANTAIEITFVKFELFLKIDIANKGFVIPEYEQSKIFSRFYRGQNAQSQEGSGIGLYLSREIISRQGGYIKVKSDQDKTIFSIFLPLEI